MSPFKRILIVDDDRNVTIWLASLFRRFGYNVFVAEDGIQAMSMLRQHRPDVVLVDYIMPAGSGFFVLESLKKHADYCDTPVIIMSGDPSMEPELFLRHGAAACISKTADAITLLQTVRQVMEPADGAAPAAETPAIAASA